MPLCLEFCQRRLGAGGRVDRTDDGGQRFAILPARIIQAIADQVDNAGLQRGGRKHRGQCFGHTFKAAG